MLPKCPFLEPVFCSMVIVAGATLVAGAAELHVPADFTTIQAALDSAASTSDEIIVAPGTYRETIEKWFTAIKADGFAVYGRAAGEIVIDGTQGKGRVHTSR